ncbi:LD-carboxypeptidase, partial [bacterium]|nr:LD-carboxypeptidase [candidate division CSSED10-310 bacterium]
MIQPPGLKPGDKVIIVAPAGPPDPDMLDRGIRFLSESGFRPVVGQHVLSRHGYLAGTDNE